MPRGIDLTPSARMTKRERERFAIRDRRPRAFVMNGGTETATYDLRLLFARVAELATFQAALRAKGAKYQPWLDRVSRSKAKPAHWYATGGESTGRVVIRVLGVRVDLPTTLMLLLHEIAHACAKPGTQHKQPWRDLYLEATAELLPGIEVMAPEVEGRYTDSTKYPLDCAVREGIIDWLKDARARAAFDDCLQPAAPAKKTAPAKRLDNGLTYQPQPFDGSLRLRAGGAAGRDLLDSLVARAEDPGLAFATRNAKVRKIEVVIDVPNDEDALDELIRILETLINYTWDGHAERAYRRLRSRVIDRLCEIRAGVAAAAGGC